MKQILFIFAIILVCLGILQLARMLIYGNNNKPSSAGIVYLMLVETGVCFLVGVALMVTLQSFPTNSEMNFTGVIREEKTGTHWALLDNNTIVDAIECSVVNDKSLCRFDKKHIEENGKGTVYTEVVKFWKNEDLNLPVYKEGGNDNE